MKLLVWKRPKETRQNVVLLFGAGLIGGSIAAKLCNQADALSTYHPFDWTDANARKEQTSSLIDKVMRLGADGFGQIAIIWSGGRSGFGSSIQDMTIEEDLLKEVLALGDTLFSRFPSADPAVHLLSSAGGLFEGRTACQTTSAPSPLRPYGEGKLAQEQRVSQLSDQISRYIYRPSSVYGYNPAGRVGLITALINNGLKAQTTHVSGKLDTQRDYVWADDIGRFVSRQIQSVQTGCLKTDLLAVGRSATMHEVIKLVERQLGRKLFLQLDPNPTNAQNIAFLQSALPQGWFPVPLGEGISSVFAQMYR